MNDESTPGRTSPPDDGFMWLDLADAADGRRPSDVDVSSTAIAHHIHYHTERVRLENEGGLLRFDEELARVAAAHSRDMRTRGYLGHETPEGDDMGARLDRFGYTPSAAGRREGVRFGENIARNGYQIPTSSDDRRINRNADDVAAHVVEQWLGSTGHRENLLDGTWVREGIGVALHPHHSGAFVFVTQVFSDA